MSTKTLRHVGENENYNFYENDITDIVNETGKDISVNCYIAKNKKGWDLNYILVKKNQVIYETSSSDQLGAHVEMLKAQLSFGNK